MGTRDPAAAHGYGLWSGRADTASLDDPHRLAFLGRKAHTLILAAPGRGWLPTGRPAETHPAHIVLAGAAGGGSVTLAGGIVVRAAQNILSQRLSLLET